MSLRIVIIILLGLVGVVGLGMSLCGGLVTLGGLAALGDHAHSGEFGMSGFLIVSVPSLLVGLALVFLAVRGIKKRTSDGGARPPR